MVVAGEGAAVIEKGSKTDFSVLCKMVSTFIPLPSMKMPNGSKTDFSVLGKMVGTF